MSFKYIFLITIIIEVLTAREIGKKFESDIRIVGGQEVTKREDFPYQVSIRFYGSHRCGGSVITSDHILTAAHCVYNGTWELLSKDVTVVAGDLDLSKSSDSTIVRQVVRITYHGQFNPVTFENDIAVLKLDKDLTPWTNYIRKISLTNQPVKFMNKLCVSSGWGYTKQGGNLSERLKMVQLPIVPHGICIWRYGHMLKNGMFCAGYLKGGQDTCQGDSGGPLVCNKVLYGIVSVGMGCGLPSFPGIYTNTYYFKEWILEKGLKGLRGCKEKLSGTSFVLFLCIVTIYFLI